MCELDSSFSSSELRNARQVMCKISLEANEKKKEKSSRFLVSQLMKKEKSK